jgi:anthranilate synthase component I
VTASALLVHPDPDAFRALAERWPLVPMWTELLADVSTPVGLFPSLAGDGPAALLESVERSERWGRYSFVAGDPAAILTVDDRGVRLERQTRELPAPPRVGDDAAPGPSGAFAELGRVAAGLRGPRLEELPALTGGLVGFLSYESVRILDDGPPIAVPPADAAPVPPMRFMVVDRAVVFDHWRQRLLLVVHVPGRAGHAAGAAALDELLERVQERSALGPEPLRVRPGRVELAPNVTEDRFREAVATAKEHILAGDIFQVVLSRRLSTPVPDGGFPIYRRLRVANPAPYMFFLRMPGLELAGSSPEPLVRVERGRVLTRPIAGTRPRGGTPEEDAALARELAADPKERAEHAMLVDLARNDLGRVCRAGTVSVTELMAVERFSRVMHLVSTVEGDLRDGLGALHALAATFPAGTVTGAPKRRAMEIIADQEPSARGAYAGAVGYLTFAGDLDFCITIRTAVVANGVAHVQSGAGIVADSDPEGELRETEAKAAALLPALTGVEVADRAGAGIP